MTTIFADDIQDAIDLKARSLWYLGNPMKIHLDGSDTNGRLALIETVTRPGSEPPMHVHTREDETFVVLEGRVKVIVGGEEHILKPGDVKFAPRGIPHTFRILTPYARTFGVITPAGFENFFRMLSEPAMDNRPPDPSRVATRERVGEAAMQFGVRLV